MAEKIEKLKSSKFKQQALPELRWIPTYTSSALMFSGFAAIFLTFGIAIQLINEGTFEIVMRYDEDCQPLLNAERSDGTRMMCRLNLPVIQETVKAPIYFYYKLDRYYQNHRRYFSSRNDLQLAGNYLTLD